MCVENYSYSTLQGKHKQANKYNKSINRKNNYFFYKKVLFTNLMLKKSSQIKIY